MCSSMYTEAIPAPLLCQHGRLLLSPRDDGNLFINSTESSFPQQSSSLRPSAAVQLL